MLTDCQECWLTGLEAIIIGGGSHFLGSFLIYI